MPICPKCKGAHLEQTSDHSRFVCPDCGQGFTLVPDDDKPFYVFPKGTEGRIE